VHPVNDVDGGFAGKAEWFDQTYRETSHGRIRLDLVLERLFEVLPPPPATVLDVGGGTGAFAVPLAARGYEVTVLDPATEWLDLAGRNAAAAGVALTLVEGTVQDLVRSHAGAKFDAILCHTVLLYLADSVDALTKLGGLAHPGTILSVLEKNREGLAVRPGLAGDHAEAIRVLDDPFAAGRLGIVNRARSAGEVRSLLLRAGWRADGWIGVRLFSDMALTLDEQTHPLLLELDRRAGRREPYRRVARLIHLLARPLADPPESLEMLQARSFARASAATLRAWPPEKAMSGPELEEFLAAPRYGVVSTARPDGRPHAAMAAFRLYDGRLWLPTVAGAARVRNVDQEPSVTVTVSEGTGEAHATVMIEGEAIVHPDPQPVLSQWLRASWERGYGTQLDWAGRIIEVIPTKVLSYVAASRS
jgi:S-adenosylmethionine-dependent methyltransferase